MVRLLSLLRSRSDGNLYGHKVVSARLSVLQQKVGTHQVLRRKDVWVRHNGLSEIILTSVLGEIDPTAVLIITHPLAAACLS